MFKLSVALITYNESVNIRRTLTALQGLASEIIIVDSHSTDDTCAVATELGATVYDEDWKGFGSQKNSAIDKCSNEWILLLDADEVVTKELKAEIIALMQTEPEYKVYKLNRSSVCFNKELKYGGWSRDYTPRLFKKGYASYGDQLVHEKFITKENMSSLDAKLMHYSYIDMRDYIERLNKYTTLGAKEYYKNKKKVTLKHILFNPMITFIKMYFFKAGFLDGVEGFVIACTSGMYTLIKYFKLREIYKNKSYLDE